MSLLVTKGLGRSGGSSLLEDITPDLVEIDESICSLEIDNDNDIEIIELGKDKGKKVFK